MAQDLESALDNIIGYNHQMVMISVVGTGITLPFDVEPYKPGDSEYGAGKRLAGVYCEAHFSGHQTESTRLKTMA